MRYRQFHLPEVPHWHRVTEGEHRWPVSFVVVVVIVVIVIDPLEDEPWQIDDGQGEQVGPLDGEGDQVVRDLGRLLQQAARVLAYVQEQALHALAGRLQKLGIVRRIGGVLVADVEGRHLTIFADGRVLLPSGRTAALPPPAPTTASPR